MAQGHTSYQKETAVRPDVFTEDNNAHSSSSANRPFLKGHQCGKSCQAFMFDQVQFRGIFVLLFSFSCLDLCSWFLFFTFKKRFF